MAEQEENAVAKIHTQLKYGAGIVAAIGTIGASFLALDSRYASAADVQKVEQNVQRQVQMVEHGLTSQMNQQRLQTLEDQIFLLETKKAAQKNKLSPVDQALHERTVRQLEQAQRQQIDLQNKTRVLQSASAQNK